MGYHPAYQLVEHDGKNHVKLHSGSPIECQGDAEIISQIYPHIEGTTLGQSTGAAGVKSNVNSFREF